MLRFYSPFFLFCFVLLVDRKLAGAHFPPDNQHHSHPASTLLSPCTFTIYLFFVCLFVLRQSASRHPRRSLLQSTSPDNIQKSAHVGTCRKGGGGGIQSWPLCSLCKLCPTLCHTLWIRWVIAKQPGVIEDAVVIAMGVFDRTSFTGSVSHWSPTTPPPQKKKGVSSELVLGAVSQQHGLVLTAGSGLSRLLRRNKKGTLNTQYKADPP